jgi:chromosome segregation ATPase
MGATRDFVSATVADALLPAFRRPVEDIIYETLDRRQVPTRTDFKEMRDLLNSLRGQVSGASNGIRKVVEQAEETEDLIDQLSERLDTIEAHVKKLEGIEALSARLAAVEASLISAEDIDARIQAAIPNNIITAADLEARLAQIPTPTPAPVVEAEPELEVEAKTEEEEEADREGCKVSGCKSKGRARGFCARHYQRWRRGTLDGDFVSLEGTVKLGEQIIQLDAKLAGESYEITDGVVWVAGVEHSAPEA